MTDAEYEAQVKRIQALTGRWQLNLGLRHWTVTHVYERSDFHSNGNYEPGVLATCGVHWQYMLATVTWNMPKVQHQTHNGLEEAYVHEMMHILVNEMRGKYHTDYAGAVMSDSELEHEERVCTMLANALIWTRDGDAIEMFPNEGY